MFPKLIYLDTNLWNRLLDQGAGPKELLAELKRRDATLVLSAQTVYLFAKPAFERLPEVNWPAAELRRLIAA